MAQTVKNLPAMQENWGSIPGSGRSPGEGNVYSLYYSSLQNSDTEEAGRLQSMGLQTVRHY